MSKEQLFGISDLASEFDLTHRAIRLYEDKGLLQPQRINGNRIYTHRDRARLIIILRGKRMGFTLQEIAEYLELYDRGDRQETQNRHLLTRVENRIERLEQQRQDLELTLQHLGKLKVVAQAALDNEVMDLSMIPRLEVLAEAD